MNKFEIIMLDELKDVNGGKYYGNGVHCSKTKCYVDWAQGWNCIAQRGAAAWMTGGKATIGFC